MMDDVPAGSDPHPGSISRFTILETLGEGAMGVVYRARDTLLQRDVALKLIRHELAGEARNRTRFLRECRAAATINHPGVATIYEAGETDDGRLFLASELVDGETLKDRLSRGPLPPAEVIAIGIQLADALEAAHAKGAIHRDVKPANLMLTPEGKLKTLDFGLARLVSADDSDGDDDRTVDMTQEGAVVGTPAYMSPEQASGMNVDSRTDIFSAGCVLYELVTGKSPFRSDSVPETLRRVLCEEPPSIKSSAEGIPIGLEEVLRGAMAKDRDGRTASAGTLAENLRALREMPSTIASGAVTPAEKSRRLTLMLGGLAGSLAIVVAAALIWQWSRPSLAFASSDRLLVADVENLTGDEAFDLALHTALETDLKQSHYVTIFQQNQVKQTLRLMRQPADSFVDEDLGRDICRFSGVRAMILPRILSVGDAYELQAAIVDPQTGRQVDRIRVLARGRDEVLLEAIDELTYEVRSRLGESLQSIEEADFPIAVATTSTWEALHYFAMANQKWGRGKFDEAVRLYELALDLDPEFATCRGSLGLLLIQFGNQPERGREELRQALVDGETLPRSEYLMLRAVNRHFVDGDLEGALGEYELVNGIFPDHMAAYNNRGRILTQLGRFDEAAVMYEKAAALDRQSAFPLVNLSFMYLTLLPNAVAAEDVCRRLVALDPEVANYHSMLGWALAVQGRYDEAQDVLETALELEPGHAFAMPNLGYTLMAAGKPDLALLYLRQNLARIRENNLSGAVRGGILEVATALAASGDREQARLFVDDAFAEFEAEMAGRDWALDDHAYVAQLLAAAGRFEEGEEQLAILMAMEADNADVQFEVARACAVLGHRECAIDATRKAFEMGMSDPYLPMLIPSMNSLLGDPEFMALFPVGESEGGS